jgi:HK97 family phage major capsid protein
MTLQEMKQAQKAALEKAEACVQAAETGNRAMTDAENETYNAAMAEFRSMGVTAKAREEQNTVRAAFGNHPMVETPRSAARFSAFRRDAWRTEEYLNDFAAFIMSNGKITGEHLHLGADELSGVRVPALRGASYEGGATSGVSIVPVVIEQQIVPLAPPVIGIESIASVLPTTSDLKFPRKKAHGAADVKAEGTGNGTNVFTGTSPQTEQYTLSAFMVGHPEDISWELSQDVPAFLSFLQDDILLSIAVLKESFYAAGTGTGQPQGIKGNVGAGVTGVAAGTDNYQSELLTASLDVIGTLNPVYRANSRWLMTVATSIAIRKAQLTDNLFSPIFTTVGDTDYLHGRPVTYSASVDEIGATKTPLYFGDFKAGYQIGIRGGAGVNVKFLDQPKALEGLLTVLGYQRVDGRVRRSEAIQGVSLT